MSKAKYPRVEIPNIEKLSISSKKGSVRVSFEVPYPGPEILKLIFMQGKAAPMTAIIESPQAEFDIVLTQVEVATGEIKQPREVTDVED